LVGRLAGEGGDPVILAASYDTLPAERDGRGPANGAAAAGAAVVLEAGRILAVAPRPYPVWLLFLEGDGLAGGMPADQATSELLRFPGSAAAAAELLDLGLVERVRLVVFVGPLPGPRFVVERDLRSHRMSRESIWQSAGALGAEQMFPANDGFASPQAGHLAFLAAGMRPTVALVGRSGTGSPSPATKIPGAIAEAAELERLGRVMLESIDQITQRLRRLEAFTKSPLGEGAPESVSPSPGQAGGGEKQPSSPDAPAGWP
jgi:hypothetical protein